MNNVYKIRWNKLKALWECVSECSSSAVHSKKALCLLPLTALCFAALPSHATVDISFKDEGDYIQFEVIPTKAPNWSQFYNVDTPSEMLTRKYLENYVTKDGEQLTDSQKKKPFRIKMDEGVRLIDNNKTFLEGMKASEKAYFLDDGSVNPDYNGDVLVLDPDGNGLGLRLDDRKYPDDPNSFNGKYITQAPGSKIVIGKSQKARIVGIMMADVHNELKGKIETTALWIGNGGKASNTSLGGAQIELSFGAKDSETRAIYINFNDEEEYELGESSKGGKFISGMMHGGVIPENDPVGLFIMSTGVTRVTAEHEFDGPVKVFNGTLQFEDQGYLHKTRWKYDPPQSIWTGNENPGTIAYKISKGNTYHARGTFYGSGKLLKKGDGTLIFDTRELTYGSTEPHEATIYLTEPGGPYEAEKFAWYLDENNYKVVAYDENFGLPITDPKRGAYTLTVTHYGHYVGEHHYKGSTLIEGGTFLLEKDNILTDTSDVQIHAKEDMTSATFHLRGYVNDKAKIVLSRDANSDSVNTLRIDGTRQNGLNIVQGSERSDSIKSVVDIINSGTLYFNDNGTAFENFVTDPQQGEDCIELGEGRNTFEVAEGKTVTQFHEAAISDLDRVNTPGAFIKDGKGTFVVTAKNRFQGAVQIKDGTLQLGNQTGAQAQTLGGRGNVETLSETAYLSINLNDRYQLLNNEGEARKLTGKGGLEQVGSGTTVVDQDHTYEGWTVIRGGTLEVTHTGELGHSDKPIITGVDAKKGVLAFNETEGQTRTWDRGITGTGSVEKVGAGTLELTNNANDFTGGVTIKEGTLRVASTAPLGTHDTVTIGATASTSVRSRTVTSTPSQATFEMANNSNLMLNRHLQGDGALLKTQSGALALSPDYKYEHKGPTSVQDGELVLMTGSHVPNSSVAAEKATLRTLDGVHKVGALSLSDQSTTVIHATNLHNYGQLESALDVKLAGKLMVDVQDWATNDNFKGPKLANVIKSSTTLTDSEYASYEDNSALFNFVPEYHYGDADGHVMHLVIKSATAPVSKCGNRMGVLECIVRERGHDKAVPEARVLDKEFEAHPDSLISQQFYTLADDDKADAAAVAALPLMTGSINSVTQNRVDRLARYGYDTQAPFVKTQDDGANLWVNIAQNYSRQDTDHGATGWTDNATEVALGRDVPIWDGQTRIGLMAGYATGEVKSKGTAAEHKADVDVYQLGLYGKHHFEAMDLAFRAGYAYAKIDGERRLNWVNKTAKSDTHANILYAGVKVSKPMAWATPFASLNTHWVRSAGYQEQGAGVLDLDVLKQTRQSAVLMGGVDFQKSLKDGRFNVAATAGLGVELLDTENDIEAAFRGLPGQYFTTESADRGRMVGKFALKASYQMTENTSLAAGYQLDWREGFQSQTGNVKLEIAF